MLRVFCICFRIGLICGSGQGGHLTSIFWWRAVLLGVLGPVLGTTLREGEAGRCWDMDDQDGKGPRNPKFSTVGLDKRKLRGDVTGWLSSTLWRPVMFNTEQAYFLLPQQQKTESKPMDSNYKVGYFDKTSWWQELFNSGTDYLRKWWALFQLCLFLRVWWPSLKDALAMDFLYWQGVGIYYLVGVFTTSHPACSLFDKERPF